MSTAAIRHPALRPRPRRAPVGPAQLNGDQPLSAAQAALYMAYHAARNARNNALSRREHIRTRHAPACRSILPTDISPPRAALNSFFAFAAETLAPELAERDATILDIGCGGAPCLPFFEAAGYRGTYIGLDVARHPRWTDAPTRAFRKRLILADAAETDARLLPPLDLVISSTALEHIREDALAIARLSARLRPGGAQVHYVPGEGALPLYGPHGWRQYSPRCLRALFPDGVIYRAGGPISAVVHRLAITRPTQQKQPTWMIRYPGRYRLLRDLALSADRVLGNRPATMYGVIARA